MEYNEFVTLEGAKMGSNGWGCICKIWNGVHEDWILIVVAKQEIHMLEVKEKAIER